MSSENQEVATPQENNAVLSGDPKTETPETNTDWKASLSDEVRADKSLENIKDIESLAKSYVHAQKLVGADKIPVPNKFATDKDWDAVYSKLGRPETADGYKYNLPEDQKVDEEGLKVFSEHAHKLGLLPTQAEGMVKFYNDMRSKELAAADTTALAARENAMNELKTEYGQAYDQKTAKAYNLVQEHFPKGIMNLNLEDGTKIGDHPAMIRAMVSIAEKMGEDNIVQASGPNYQTPKELEKNIASITGDPKSAYCDKNHPNHAMAVEEVTDLFRQKHGEEQQ